MIIFISAFLGALFGVMQARKRKGNRKDMAQYAAGYGFAFLILGLFATVIIDRLAG